MKSHVFINANLHKYICMCILISFKLLEHFQIENFQYKPIKQIHTLDMCYILYRYLLMILFKREQIKLKTETSLTVQNRRITYLGPCHIQECYRGLYSANLNNM